MRGWLFAVVLAVFPFAGCSCSGAGVDELPFACTSDTECETPDWLCRRGACVRADAGCAAALEICDDGLENDCDELIDCADDECAALTCGAAGRTCQGAACACPPGGSDGGFTETQCADGLDDDCDGVVDCDDSDCAGSVCSANGLVCVGASCACPPEGQDGGVTAETTCTDGVDNDCDQLVDCADPSCEALACGAAGTCTAGACICTGGGTPEVIEATCDDGSDNDCDALSDCSDVLNCSNRRCAPNGQLCNAAGACVCSGNGGTAQPTGETSCGDGRDNDCDGTTDCADEGCSTRSCGTNGRVCLSGSCVCNGNGGTVQSAETVCNDARDNDCDGLTDCAETACSGQSCGANGRVCFGTGPNTCVCSGNGGPSEGGGEVSCSDGFDNDCDGLIDCEDTGSCGGQSCGPGNGFTCNANTCSCTAGGGTVELSGETICTDGRDNDCDGLTDCEEEVCNVGGAELNCRDGADNDCDGAPDCADSDCLHEICGTDSVCCSVSAVGCRDMSADEVNCGGCGIACDTRGSGETCEEFEIGAEDSGRCSCNVHSDCTRGQTCSSGNCVCATAANCADGQICDNGTCRY